MVLAIHSNLLRFLTLCAIWGSTWIGTKAGVDAVPPLLFGGTRFTAAGTLILIYAFLKGETLKLSPSEMPRILLVSVLMIPLCYGPLYWGMQFIGSGTAAVLEMSLTPIGLLCFALFLGEESWNWRRIAGIALGVLGLFVLFWPEVAATPTMAPQPFPRAEFWGSLAVASAALTCGGGSVLARPLLRSHSALLTAGLTTLIGGLILLLISLTDEPGAAIGLSGHWGIAAWGGWLFLVIFGSLIGYTTYLKLVRDIGASRAGSYAFISPIIAVALGAFIFGEHITALDVAAILILFAAAYLALTDTHRTHDGKVGSQRTA